MEAFLTHLAVEGWVAPSTQNQALNALLFLYGRVLEQPLEKRVNAVRARRHHLDPGTVDKALRVAVGNAGLGKRVTSHTFRHPSATHLPPLRQMR